MKELFILLLIACGYGLYAQAPAGYYDNANSLTGDDLKAALHDIIKGHTSISYSQLWDAYHSTDLKPGTNKIWDMYSDIPGGAAPYEFDYGTDQCGSINYNSEGDCYNREHSFPKSYFNSQMPMYTDLFIVMPADGYVNGKRGNYAYGEVSNANWTSDNGSKLGPNGYPNSGGGTCFEPIDSFKGDLARNYFYIATRYYSEDNGWDNWVMANGATLKPWAVQMLLEWSHEDPVSQKEIDRNNAVFQIQHNRNPFIDHPEWIDCIWGNSTACSSNTGTQNISNAGNDITVYPNPAQGSFYIKLSGHDKDHVNTTLYNLQGKEITVRPFSKSSIMKINTKGMAAGIYFLKICSGSSCVIKKVAIL